MLTKVTIETALNAELDEHLGYEIHQINENKNSGDGRSGKTLITDDGEIDIQTLRDRAGSFEPKLIKKHQTRFASMDDKILSRYAKGLSNWDILKKCTAQMSLPA